MPEWNYYHTKNLWIWSRKIIRAYFSRQKTEINNICCLENLIKSQHHGEDRCCRFVFALNLSQDFLGFLDKASLLQGKATRVQADILRVHKVYYAYTGIPFMLLRVGWERLIEMDNIARSPPAIPRPIERKRGER